MKSRRGRSSPTMPSSAAQARPDRVRRRGLAMKESNDTPTRSRGSFQSHQLAPPVMTALAAVGFGVGLLVMLWRYGSNPDSQTFVQRPETLAWIVALAFSVAFWAATSPLLWADVVDLPKDRRSRLRSSDKIVLGLGLIAFFAMLGAPILVSSRI